MAAHAFPIEQIQRAGQFGTSLPRVPILPSPVRRALLAFVVPAMLRYINRTLSGEGTGRLSIDQAETLYKSLHPMYLELQHLLEASPKRPLLVRLLAKRWYGRLAVEVEDLGDVLETLAWISDSDLHSSMKAMVAAIEPSPEPCHR